MNPPQASRISQGLAPSLELLHPSAAAAATTSAAEAPKLRRISRPKVKSGCVTCKKRHVKCDEAKPTCSRCIKASVECLGYHEGTGTPEDGRVGRRKRQRRLDVPIRTLLPRPPPPPQSSTSPSPSPSPSPYNNRRTSDGGSSTAYVVSSAASPSAAISPLPPPPLPSSPSPSSSSSCCTDPADAAYLDLFHNALSRALAGPIPSRFWSRTVPREMGRDSCVRSAVLAIAALATSVRRPGHDDGDDDRPRMTHHGTVRDRHHQTAIAHYTEAVSAFRERMGMGGSGSGTAACPSRSVLMATVLFVTYELLQGNDEAADGLIMSGMNLLRDSLGILGGGDGDEAGSTVQDIGSATTKAARESPPMLLLPEAISEGGGAGSLNDRLSSIDLYNENDELGSSSLSYDDPFSCQEDNDEDDDDVYDDGDEMHEIEHILPRLSVLGGMCAFFPRQQDERTVALLRTTPKSEFPPPPSQGHSNIEQLASMWSDFSTRCLIWARRQAWLSQSYVRSSGVLPRAAVEEDPASLLAAQGELRALLGRWRAVLAEHRAMEAAAGGGELFCPSSSSCTSEDSSNNNNPLLGLQGPWSSDSLVDSTPKQQSEIMRALSVMELHVVFCDAFVAGCLDPTTLTYDALTSNFAEMIALAKDLLPLRRGQGLEQQHNPTSPGGGTSLGFTLGAGLVAPLAFVAAHCRDRALRMEAIELLRLGEQREGAHDARVQAVGLLALVGLEEEGSVGGSAAPPLASRYIWSGARYTEGNKLVAQFTRVVPDSLGNAVLREMALEL